MASLDAIALPRGVHRVRPLRQRPRIRRQAVADWCTTTTDAVFIGPGSSWQNAWIESYNGKLCGELLNGWHFDSLLEAQAIIGAWQTDYNQNQPHTALNGLSPNEYAVDWTKNLQPQPA